MLPHFLLLLLVLVYTNTTLLASELTVLLSMISSRKNLENKDESLGVQKGTPKAGDDNSWGSCIQNQAANLCLCLSLSR